MLWGVDASDIVEGGDESAERNKYLILRVSIDTDSARLKGHVNLLELVPEVVCIAVELVVILLPLLQLQLYLPINRLGLHQCQLGHRVQLQFQAHYPDRSHFPNSLIVIGSQLDVKAD